MRNQLLIATLLLLFLPHCVSAQDSNFESMHGVWFGSTIGGQPVGNALRTILIVTEMEIHFASDTGVATATVSTRASNEVQQIDVIRDSKEVQRGTFKLRRDHLYLTLANPGQDRPIGDGASNVQHAHYVFTRLPTVQGIEVLKNTLASEISRRQIEDTASNSFGNRTFPASHPEWNLPVR